MRADLLHVVTARFDPIRWRQPQRHFLDWCTAILDAGAKLTVVEVAYGKSEFRAVLHVWTTW